MFPKAIGVYNIGSDNGLDQTMVCRQNSDWPLSKSVMTYTHISMRYPASWVIASITYLQLEQNTSWRRHQMETLSALLALCEVNPPVTNGFPSQRQVTRSFGVFFDLRLYKRSCKQSERWGFETPSRSSWHHCNEFKQWCLLIGKWGND